MKVKQLFTCVVASIAMSTPLMGSCEQIDQADQLEQSPMHKMAQFFDDTAITTKVKANLIDVGLQPFEISVQTYNNRVILSGFVDSQEDAVLAVETAKSVDGVLSVSSNLVVKK